MTISVRRLVPAALAVALLAGCGASASAGKTGAKPTAASQSTQLTAPQSTPTAAATPVITGGSVAATVNGHPIPMSTYRLLVTFGLRQYAGQPGATPKAIAAQAMKQVVMEEVVRQYAAAHHISVSSSQMQAEITSEQKQAGSVAKFNATLARAGLTKAEYERVFLQPNLLGQRVSQVLFPIRPKLVPSAHVRHILISLKPTGKPARTNAQAKALATRILGQVQHGGNFATLASKYSDDPGTAAHGGDLGTIYRGQMVAPFDHAAFTLAVNHPALIHTVYGWHIIEVLSRGKSQQPAQAEQQQQQQKFTAWVNAQTKTATVKELAKVK